MTVKELKEKIDKYEDDYEIVFLAPLNTVLDYKEHINCISDHVLLIKLVEIPQ